MKSWIDTEFDDSNGADNRTLSTGRVAPERREIPRAVPVLLFYPEVLTVPGVVTDGRLRLRRRPAEGGVIW